MLASTNFSLLAYTKEKTFGVIPEVSDVGFPRFLRYNSESFNYDKVKEASQELGYRTDAAVFELSAASAGTISTEVSYREYDPLIEAILQGTWKQYSSGPVGAVVFTAGSISGSISGTFDVTGLSAGQFFKVTGSGTANDNKVFRAASAANGLITLDVSTPATPGTGSATTAFYTSRLVNGNTQTSFSFERQNIDTREYWCYTGMTPSKMDMQVSAREISTLNFEFVGKGLNRLAMQTNLDEVPVPPWEYEIHTGATSGHFWFDGIKSNPELHVRSMSLSYDNTLRDQYALGDLHPIGYGSGTITITGIIEVYFSSAYLYNKYLSNEGVPITFATYDTKGNGYVITLPKVVFTNYGTNAAAKDDDLILRLEYFALAKDGEAIQIDRTGEGLVIKNWYEYYTFPFY